MSAGIKVAVQVRMEVAAIPVYHTGTESRDLLPLWKRAARGIGLDRSLEGPYYGFSMVFRPILQVPPGTVFRCIFHTILFPIAVFPSFSKRVFVSVLR